MSTLQAVNSAHADVQQAAQLWTPQFTTAGNSGTFYYGATTVPAPPVVEAPRRRTPLEWLDDQISDITALAMP